MMTRETAPRTSTLSRGLAVLGLGALLLPLMPSWAQPPQTGAQPGVERPDPAQREPFQDKLQALEKAQLDIRRMQEDLERARQDLERRTQDLNRKMDQVKRAASAAAANPPVERKSSAPKGAQVGQRPAAMAGPALPPGEMMGGAGNPGADLEKRLREVERKLDMIIQMMRRGQPGGFQGGPVPPGAGTDPLLVPTPPAVTPGAGRRFSQQQPVTPTAPPAPAFAPIAPQVAPAAPRFENQPLQPLPAPPSALPRQPAPEEVDNPDSPLGQ